MKQYVPSSDECKCVYNESGGNNKSVVNNNHPVSPSKNVLSDETIPNETCTNKTCGQYINTEKLKIVFIDWDDTLCPTYAIFKAKDDNINLRKLQLFGRHIYQLLSTYIQLFGLNNVYIVTNGSNNWVQQSLITLSNLCKQIPGITDYFALIYNEFLCKYRMNVISAQHFYFQHHKTNITENQPTMKWKLFTFKSVVYNHLKQNKSKISSVCILSIGDSMDEYNASYYTKQWMQQKYNIKHVLLHRVKLGEKPSVDYWMNECRLLISLMNK